MGEGSYPSLSPQEVTSLPQGERLVPYADSSAVSPKVRYFQNIALISPLAGEMSLQATERGFFLFEATPTPNPPLKGEGVATISPKRSESKGKNILGAALNISLPLEGRVRDGGKLVASGKGIFKGVNFAGGYHA